MFERFKQIFRRIARRKTPFFTTLISIIFVVSFSFCFISGSINPSVRVEQSAEYVANVAKTHTKNGQYAALLVEPNKKTDKKLIDTGIELYSLYGIFRENIASFVSTVNADHLYDVRFKDIDSNNLSYVYVTSGFNSVPYHGHYKHEYYPLELMFNREKDPESWDHKSFSHLLYISQTQADRFLDNDGLEHTTENYQSLLKKRIFLTTDGVEREWQIEDIYLQQNYFYDAVTECAGEFVFAWSPEAFLQGPKKQSLYFLSSYAFRNSFYFNYATSLYPQSDFDYKISNFNFIDDYQIDSSRLVFSVDNQSSIGSSFVLAVGILFLILDLALVYFALPEIKWWHHLLFAASAVTPYLFFKLLYLIANNTALFSSFATTSNMIIMLCAVFIYAIIVLLRKRKTNAIG